MSRTAGRIARRTLVLGAVVLGVLIPVSPATTSSASAEPAAPDVHIVNLNLLHGAFCPPETDGCQAPDRVELLLQQLEDSGCPDVVGLQEINQHLSDLLAEAHTSVCDGEYELAFPTKQVRNNDTEQVLTTLPIKGTKVIKLVGNFRGASRVTLKSPIGPLVLVVTHQDGNPETPSNVLCKSCKPPCSTDRGVYECQTDAAAGLADETGSPKAIRVLMGDFNVTPGSDRYQNLIAAGWTDTHLAAGNAECDPATGVNCTGGREDKSVDVLKDPNAREAERIDFIFVKPPASCDVSYDTIGDDDGDFLGTGLWKNTPATDGPGGLVWTSDHTGVSADLTCSDA
jgi:endonuclease/exonuclease/phosphatase family metal-dependent hydrolase